MDNQASWGAGHQTYDATNLMHEEQPNATAYAQNIVCNSQNSPSAGLHCTSHSYTVHSCRRVSQWAQNHLEQQPSLLRMTSAAGPHTSVISTNDFICPSTWLQKSSTPRAIHAAARWAFPSGTKTEARYSVPFDSMLSYRLLPKNTKHIQRSGEVQYLD